MHCCACDGDEDRRSRRQPGMPPDEMNRQRGDRPCTVGRLQRRLRTGDEISPRLQGNARAVGGRDALAGDGQAGDRRRGDGAELQGDPCCGDGAVQQRDVL